MVCAIPHVAEDPGPEGVFTCAHSEARWGKEGRTLCSRDLEIGSEHADDGTGAYDHDRHKIADFGVNDIEHAPRQPLHGVPAAHRCVDPHV